MPNSKLRVGIIGVGMIALMSHIPNLRSTGRAEIVAICRRDPRYLAMAQERLNVPEAYTDWREMLDRAALDAVVVSTPNHMHTAPTLAALERGLHVLVQKPMALHNQDAWAMVDAAERADRVLMVAFGLRFMGIWRTVKRRLNQGIIGEIRQINLAFSSYRRWIWEAETSPAEGTDLVRKLTGMPDGYFAGWRTWHRDPAQMGGGMFADMGPHVIDLALWLAGAPPVEVTALSETAGLPVECFMNVQARLANGALLSLTSADAPMPNMLESKQLLMIAGDRGVLTADTTGDVWVYGRGIVEKIEPELPDVTSEEVFVSAIFQGENDPSLAREAAYVVALIEAAYSSARKGGTVQIHSAGES